MAKLTAKLRDAVPVCLLVEGKEIKRYKNIEIPDELKALEYQDFKFDVPLSGVITFKIMFEPGVLPEVFPQTRERKTRQPMPQGAEPQESAPAAGVTAEAETKPQPQDEKATEALPASSVEASAQALEEAQTAGEPVADIEAAMADGEAIKAEIIEVEGEGRLVVITVEPEAKEAMPDATETKAESESVITVKKPIPKGKIKKNVSITDSGDR